MPRKYHRPPDTTTKRRKTRRSTVPYEFEAPPPEAAVAEDELSDDELDSELPAKQTIRTTSGDGLSPKGERHVNVDYSYVRGDVIRIAAMMGFLVIALAITSIFR